MADGKSGIFPLLQDLCLLSLINNAQDYPPDTLKLVPPTLRRRLVPLLPAATLHELESTAVLSDIETSDPLWLNLYASFYQDTYTSLVGSNTPGYGKKSLLNKAITQVLENTTIRPLWASNCSNHIGGVLDGLICLPKSNEWIFSKPYLQLLDAYNLYVICKDCKSVCPGRFLPSPLLQPFTNATHQRIVVCDILVNIFDTFPTTISHYCQPNTIIDKGLKNGAIARFISGTKELKLHCYEETSISNYSNNRITTSQDFKSHSEALQLVMLSFPYALKLISLSLLSKAKSLSVHDLMEVVPFFAPISPPEKISLPKDFIPYALLESLTISGLPVNIEECLHLLISVINYQICLKEVNITCHGQHDVSDLLESLTCTFKRSERVFKQLALKGTKDSGLLSLSTQCFADSLNKIFTISPLVGEEQILELEFVTVDNLVSHRSKSPNHIQSISLNKETQHQVVDCPGKVLTLRDMTLTGNAMKSLLSIMPHYHLDKLNICTSLAMYEHLSYWQDMTTLTANQITLEFNLSVRGGGIAPSFPLIGKVLSNLIMFHRVSKLILVNVSILLSPLHLLSLTEAFSKSSITKLVLKDCHLGEVSRNCNVIGSPMSITSYIQDGPIKRRIVTQFCGELVILLTSIIEYLLKTDNELQFAIQERTIDYRHLLLIHSIWDTICGSGRKKGEQSSTKLRFRILHVDHLDVPVSFREEFKLKMNEMTVGFSQKSGNDSGVFTKF